MMCLAFFGYGVILPAGEGELIGPTPLQALGTYGIETQHHGAKPDQTRPDHTHIHTLTLILMEENEQQCNAGLGAASQILVKSRIVV
ncbi:hypothetical protein F4677DRAFT_131321 [Hypoxylon crocopeplum]|nr:hypothetical protein F4677DRAFT_131321 [Hypoxylon crocopeplum]